MNRGIAFLLVVPLAATAFAEPGPATAAAARAAPAAADAALVAALSRRWAPVFIQEVCVRGTKSLGGRSDYVVAADFDASLGAEAAATTQDNWENLERAKPEWLAASVYSWGVVSEPGPHGERVAALGFAAYHPRDWSSLELDFLMHENDLEAAVLFVELPAGKDPAKEGVLRGAAMVAHSSFVVSAPPKTGWVLKNGRTAELLKMKSHEGSQRPVVFIESEGHAMRPWSGVKPSDPFITYVAGDRGAAPKVADGREVGYGLVDILDPKRGLYRFCKAGQTSLPGNNGSGTANLPTAWRDSARSELAKGAIVLDPIAFVQRVFRGADGIPCRYEFNPFTPAAKPAAPIKSPSPAASSSPAPRDLKDGEVTGPLGGGRGGAFPGDIFFVNGRGTDAKAARRQAEATAAALGQGVRLVYNDLTLPVVDDIAIAWDKLFSADVSLNAATDALAEEVRVRIQAGTSVAVIAYSGGAVVANNAFRCLDDELSGLPAQQRTAQLGRIHVLTVGSAVLGEDHPFGDGWPKELGSVSHLYHRADPVSSAFGPGDLFGRWALSKHSYLNVYLPALRPAWLTTSEVVVLH